MSNPSYLRNKFGLNQKQIAEWMGVSRSLVAHYENATRKLPSHASGKHTQLLIMMAKIETATAKVVGKRKPHPESMDRIKHAKEELEYQVKLAVHKERILKKKLLTIQKQYNQTRDLMDLIDKMLLTVTKEKDKGSFLWLRAQYAEAKKRLEKCDEAEQIKLIAKIFVLEKTAEMSYEL